MKYLKKYEELNINIPDVGDYVICEEFAVISPIREFLQKHVGKVVNINYEDRTKEPYTIYYEDAPHNFLSDEDTKIRHLTLSEIKYWSKDKNELEAILTSKKFNL